MTYMKEALAPNEHAKRYKPIITDGKDTKEHVYTFDIAASVACSDCADLSSENMHWRFKSHQLCML